MRYGLYSVSQGIPERHASNALMLAFWEQAMKWPKWIPERPLAVALRARSRGKFARQQMCGVATVYRKIIRKKGIKVLKLLRDLTRAENILCLRIFCPVGPKVARAKVLEAAGYDRGGTGICVYWIFGRKSAGTGPGELNRIGFSGSILGTKGVVGASTRLCMVA